MGRPSQGTTGTAVKQNLPSLKQSTAPQRHQSRAWAKEMRTVCQCLCSEDLYRPDKTRQACGGDLTMSKPSRNLVTSAITSKFYDSEEDLTPPKSRYTL